MENSELRELLAEATTDNPWGGPFDRQDATNALLRELPRLLADSDALQKLRAEIAGAPVVDVRKVSGGVAIQFDAASVAGLDGQRVALLRLPAGEG